MDIDMEEGEITIRLRGDRAEFADLYRELSKWNASNEHPYVRRLLYVLRWAGSVGEQL